MVNSVPLRPILKQQSFNGVLVVSVSPDLFGQFAEKLRIKGASVITVVRDTGDVMARFPAGESSLGEVIKGSPFLQAGASVSGNFRQLAAIDGVERIYGFYKLPEFGLNFVVGEAVNDILIPYDAHRKLVLGVACGISLFVVMLFYMLVPFACCSGRCSAATYNFQGSS